MNVIELITSEVCPFAQRAHMALIEKGLEFTVREVDLANKPAWFEEISPYSKVPVLKVDDEVVWESSIVNEFIDERFPDTPLMPGSPWLRAQARIWIDYCNMRWVEDFYGLLSAGEPDLQGELRDKVIRDLVYMETEGMAALSEGPYWLGASVSLVDLAYWPFFERFGMLSHYREVAIPDTCPRLRAWCVLMAERQSVRETMHEDSWYIGRYVRYADAA